MRRTTIGEYPGRIYTVELTCSIKGDPKRTDNKFTGNPTKSYRSREPVRIVGEILDWQGHSAEALKKMREGVERARQLGVDAIDD